MAATLRLGVEGPHQEAAGGRPDQTSGQRQLRPRVRVESGHDDVGLQSRVLDNNPSRASLSTSTTTTTT